MSENKDQQKSTLERVYEAGRRTDPLFGRLERDFQPTIDQLIDQIIVNDTPYRPHGSRERINFSLRPELIQEVQKMASSYDMDTSSMVDALLRVALGEYHEWMHYNSPSSSSDADANKPDLG